MGYPSDVRLPPFGLAGTREYVNSCGACNTLQTNCTAGKKGERASRSEYGDTRV